MLTGGLLFIEKEEGILERLIVVGNWKKPMTLLKKKKKTETD